MAIHRFLIAFCLTWRLFCSGELRLCFSGHCFQVNLINGCEILVSTPNSFLRMMEKKLINFKRVSHLVGSLCTVFGFADIDQVILLILYKGLSTCSVQRIMSWNLVCAKATSDYCL